MLALCCSLSHICDMSDLGTQCLLSLRQNGFSSEPLIHSVWPCNAAWPSKQRGKALGLTRKRTHVVRTPDVTSGHSLRACQHQPCLKVVPQHSCRPVEAPQGERICLFPLPRSLKPLHLATTNHLGCCNQGARAARGADLHQFRETVFLQATRARAHEASLFGFRWTHLALAPRPQLGARKVPRGSCAGLFIREHRPLWTSSFR